MPTLAQAAMTGSASSCSLGELDTEAGNETGGGTAAAQDASAAGVSVGGHGVSHVHFFTMNLPQGRVPHHRAPGAAERPNDRQCRRTALAGLERPGQRPVRGAAHFWANRESSYLARTATWAEEEFPNGRWGDRNSAAFGELGEYYLGSKRKRVDRIHAWGRPQGRE